MVTTLLKRKERLQDLQKVIIEKEQEKKTKSNIICLICNGSGWHEKRGNWQFERNCDIYSRCRHCHGTGEIILK